MYIRRETFCASAALQLCFLTLLNTVHSRTSLLSNISSPPAPRCIRLTFVRFFLPRVLYSLFNSAAAAYCSHSLCPLGSAFTRYSRGLFAANAVFRLSRKSCFRPFVACPAVSFGTNENAVLSLVARRGHGMFVRITSGRVSNIQQASKNLSGAVIYTRSNFAEAYDSREIYLRTSNFTDEQNKASHRRNLIFPPKWRQPLLVTKWSRPRGYGRDRRNKRLEDGARKNTAGEREGSESASRSLIKSIPPMPQEFRSIKRDPRVPSTVMAAPRDFRVPSIRVLARPLSPRTLIIHLFPLGVNSSSSVPRRTPSLFGFFPRTPPSQPPPAPRFNFYVFSPVF